MDCSLSFKQIAVAGAMAVGLALSNSARADTEWDKVLAAAKAEGQVDVWGQAGEDLRRYWKDAFEQAYPDIKVNLFQPASWSQRDTRFLNEMQAGLAKLDVLAGAPGSMMARLYPQDALQPTKPFIKGSELEASTWIDGTPAWVDNKGEYILAGDLTPQPPVALNASVADDQVKSFSDLLDPKFDGKIVMLDPRQSGGGFAMLVFLYHNKDLGPDYIAKLFKGGRVIFTTDPRQNAEWTESGRALINLYPLPTEIDALVKLGGKIRMVHALEAGGRLQAPIVSGYAAMGVPKIDLPHPNATKVYLTWVYSKEGMAALADILKLTPARNVVDASTIPEYAQRKADITYFNIMTEAATNAEAAAKARAIVEQALQAN